MLPIFGKALVLLKETHPDLRVVIPVVDSAAEIVRNITRDWPLQVVLVSDMAERFDAFAASNAALAKSGTVTLELALAGVPMVVAYRVSAPTAFLIRRMGVGVAHASLVNLLLGREAVPEFLQEDCTPERLAEAVDGILRSEQVRAAQREAFKDVVKALGDRTPPPSERAAKVVLGIVQGTAGAATAALLRQPMGSAGSALS
jgi:lipid-A-disaccharide synthase